MACPPDPPAGSPAVHPGIGTATVTWRSPPYDGGCMVTGYSVEMRRSDESAWTVVAEACHSLSHTVDDLQPEEVYVFRVRAENIHGASEPGLETRPVTIAEDEEQFKPCFEAREVSFEDGTLFKERYDVLEELGKGRYGIVRKAIEKSTGQHLAAKFIRTIKSKDKEQVREEVRIMNLLRHPKLLQLAAAFESPREVVMVMEYISGGELFERVVADDFTLTERDSILFMRQICEGVEYMHENKVVHLDLKPENIMCHTRTSHKIKLIDFGLAQMLKPDTPVRVLFGTPEFIPPEIINYEPIGTETDMWSVGVICYVLLTGLSPFMGENDAETFANITRADYDFDDEAFDAISQDAKEFISALLEKRKELRMSAKECLEHPWVAQHSESMSVVALPTDKLKKFIIRRKWQKTGNAIRALGRMATLSANSRRNSSANESSPTRSLSPLVSLEEGISSSPKIINYVPSESEIAKGSGPPSLNLDEIEKDSIAGDVKLVERYEEKIEENKSVHENDDGPLPVNETNGTSDLKEDVDVVNKASRRLSSDDSCIRNERTDNFGAKDPRLGKSSELLIGDNKLNESRDYLGVDIEFCNLSKSEPDEIYLSNNNVVEVPNNSNELEPEELTFPSSIVEPEDEDTPSRRNTAELVNATIIEDVQLNGFKDSSSMKRTRACSERSDSGISDCSSAAPYSQGGELSSLIIAEEDEDPHGSTFGIKLRSGTKTKKGDSVEESILNHAVDEDQDSGLIRPGPPRINTGSVSRTARMFEREELPVTKEIPTSLPRVTPSVPGKPHNDRIQKAFAFWNK